MASVAETAIARAPEGSGLVQVIEPPRGWFHLDWAELWRYRELFFFMVWRDVKVKYKQTVLGAVWAVLVPLLQMIVFTFIFGRVAGLSSDGLPQPIFYYTALLPWTYLAGSLSMAGNSLVGNAQLLTKVYFPRIIVPTSPAVAGLVDFAIAFLILLVMMAWYGIVPAATALYLPLLLLVAVGTALGTGYIFSALNVKYRDIRYALPFLVQIWMYLTVIIPFSSIPERLGPWRYLYGLNPMAGVIEGFRWCMLHPYMSVEKTVSQHVPLAAPAGPFKLSLLLEQTASSGVEAPWRLLAMGVPVMLLILAVGTVYFRRVEKSFADVI